MTFSFFIFYLIFKFALIIALAIGADLGGALLAVNCIGIVLEGIGSILMGDVDDKPVLRGILYYAGILMQVVSMILFSVPFLSQSETALGNNKIGGFLKVCGLGIVCSIIALGWFLNGFEGMTSFGYYYGAGFGIYLLEGIIFAICKSYHTTMIVNFVIAGIAALVIIIGRIALGSNME